MNIKNGSAKILVAFLEAKDTYEDLYFPYMFEPYIKDMLQSAILKTGKCKDDLFGGEWRYAINEVMYELDKECKRMTAVYERPYSLNGGDNLARAIWNCVDKFYIAMPTDEQFLIAAQAKELAR